MSWGFRGQRRQLTPMVRAPKREKHSRWSEEAGPLLCGSRTMSLACEDDARLGTGRNRADAVLHRSVLSATAMVKCVCQPFVYHTDDADSTPMLKTVL